MGPSWEGLSPLEVVCDAGPLIHLDELDCLDLLSDFASVLVPEEVWKEVAHHRPRALTHDLQLQRRAVEISTEKEFHLLVRAFSLDLGEQAALSLMRSHRSAVLLTDDAAARLAAKSLGLRTHGTIGVLLRSIRRQLRKSEEVIFTSPRPTGALDSPPTLRPTSRDSQRDRNSQGVRIDSSVFTASSG
jgi:predicted nucleic acid-binding protein